MADFSVDNDMCERITEQSIEIGHRSRKRKCQINNSIP